MLTIPHQHRPSTRHAVRATLSMSLMAAVLASGLALSGAAPVAAQDGPPPPPGDIPPPPSDEGLTDISVSSPRFVTGRAVAKSGAVPIQLRWKARNAAGISHYQVQLMRYPGPTYSDIKLGRSDATSTIRKLPLGTDLAIRVRAWDGFGNESAWEVGQRFRVVKSGGRYAGNWRTKRDRGAIGRSIRQTGSKAAKATFATDALSIAVVAQRSPRMGKAKISVGGSSRTVQLRANRTSNRLVVHQRALAGGHSATMTVRRARGTVNVDAFLAIVER